MSNNIISPRKIIPDINPKDWNLIGQNTKTIVEGKLSSASECDALLDQLNYDNQYSKISYVSRLGRWFGLVSNSRFAQNIRTAQDAIQQYQQASGYVAPKALIQASKDGFLLSGNDIASVKADLYAYTFEFELGLSQITVSYNDLAQKWQSLNGLNAESLSNFKEYLANQGFPKLVTESSTPSEFRFFLKGQYQSITVADKRDMALVLNLLNDCINTAKILNGACNPVERAQAIEADEVSEECVEYLVDDGRGLFPPGGRDYFTCQQLDRGFVVKPNGNNVSIVLDTERNTWVIEIADAPAPRAFSAQSPGIALQQVVDGQAVFAGAPTPPAKPATPLNTGAKAPPPPPKPKTPARVKFVQTAPKRTALRSVASRQAPAKISIADQLKSGGFRNMLKPVKPGELRRPVVATPEPQGFNQELLTTLKKRNAAVALSPDVTPGAWTDEGTPVPGSESKRPGGYNSDTTYNTPRHKIVSHLTAAEAPVAQVLEFEQEQPDTDNEGDAASPHETV